MRRLGAIAVVLGLSSPACMVRERRPEGPYRLAEEFADALSDVAVECTREIAPAGTGEVVVAAEFTAAKNPPRIHDLGSSPGTESVLACVRQGAAEKLRSPEARPAPFVRVRVPVPLDTSKVSYAFMQELRRPEPAP